MAYSIEQRDEQLAGTSASIRYRLSFPRRAQHLVDVVMEIDGVEGDDLVLALPNWIPGSYKVRDFISHQGDFAVTGEQGSPPAFEWISKNRVRVAGGGGRINVSYCVYGFERTVRVTHISRFHAFINPANVLMFVEGRTEEIHHVEIDHPWSKVSTSLSPVSDRLWGALNYDILIDSPIEIGDHYTATFERHGATHEVAITGAGDFDPDWITEQIKIVVDRAVELWGSLPYDRYVFINQLLPGHYGGLEHARSSVNMFDSEVFSDREKTVKFLALLCHEYFHLWNVKRIRPAELGPFDYRSENYTRMLWLAEGCTSYYDDLMAYRCGFHSRDEYISVLEREHISKLLETPGRRSTSIKDASYLSWVKLYIPTPDSHNRIASYYLEGGVIFLLLDLTIVARTDGERSLDDGMRALWRRYRADPARGVTEEEFVAIVSDAVGTDISADFLGWINSTDELPIAETVAALGLEWRVKAPRGSETFGDGLPYQSHLPAVWFGLEIDEIRTGLKIARIWKDSPAEAAGLGAEDELIAINGVRVTSSRQWGALLMGARRSGGAIRLTAASEGRVFETTIEPIHRDHYELVVREGMSDIERKRFEKWLAR